MKGYKIAIVGAIIGFLLFSTLVLVIAYQYNLKQTLNVVSVLDDPSKLQLSGMSIADRDADSVTWQIDLQIANEGTEDLLFPRLNFDVYILGSKLGIGWIPNPVKIAKNTTGVIPAYIKMDRGIEFSLLINGLLQGSAMTLDLDAEVLIMLDVWFPPTINLIELPVASLSIPIELPMALSEGDQPSLPSILTIIQGGVVNDTNVVITTECNDKGGGLKSGILSYTNDTGATWYNVSMTGFPSYPASSNWFNFNVSGIIPAASNPNDTTVEYKVYIYDDYDNLAESTTFSYNVNDGNGTSYPVYPTGIFSINSNGEEEVDFLGAFMDYLAAAGVHLEYLLIDLMPPGFDILSAVPDIATFFLSTGFTLEQATTFVDQFIGNMTIAFSILTDAGLSIANLLNAIGADLGQFGNVLVDQIGLPTTDNLTEVAIELCTGTNTAQNDTLNQTLVSIFGPDCSSLNAFLLTFKGLSGTEIIQSRPQDSDPILNGCLSLLRYNNETNWFMSGFIQALYNHSGSFEAVATAMGTEIIGYADAIGDAKWFTYQAVMLGSVIYLALGLAAFAAWRGETPARAPKTKWVGTRKVDRWFYKNTEPLRPKEAS